MLVGGPKHQVHVGADASWAWLVYVFQETCPIAGCTSGSCMGLGLSRSRVYNNQEACNTANAALPVRHGGLGAACHQTLSLHVKEGDECADAVCMNCGSWYVLLSNVCGNTGRGELLLLPL